MAPRGYWITRGHPLHPSKRSGPPMPCTCLAGPKVSHRTPMNEEQALVVTSPSAPHLLVHLKPPTDMKTLVMCAPLTAACPADVLEVLNYRLWRAKRFPRIYLHSTVVFQTLDAGEIALGVSLMWNPITSLHSPVFPPH